MAQRILAVASGGGHWVQLNRVIRAFDGHEVTFATVADVYREDVPGCRFYRVPDATRWNPLRLIALGVCMLLVVLRERPDVVISTGAAPGCIAIVIGNLLGARTVWLDSIANVEEMSYSGRLVRRCAGLWLTQWPHLASEEGPEYAGRVL